MLIRDKLIHDYFENEQNHNLTASKVLFHPLIFSFFPPGVVSEKLLSMYSKELVLKEKLIPEFIRTEDRETLMLYISLWLHEPYLEDSHKLLLESMLIEAELK